MHIAVALLRFPHGNSDSALSNKNQEFDARALTTYSGPIHFTSIGAHSVLYYSVDKAGNPEAARTDPFVINALPVINGLNPNSVKAGSGAFTLIVTGTGFAPGTVGMWNTTVVNTDYVSPTEVLMGIPASIVAAPSTDNVTVITSPGQSLPAALTVTAPTPVITSLSPNPVIAGGPYFWLTIYGTNFAPGDYVWVNTAVSPVVAYISPKRNAGADLLRIHRVSWHAQLLRRPLLPGKISSIYFNRHRANHYRHKSQSCCRGRPDIHAHDLRTGFRPGGLCLVE
ncbi:MAG: hypothetical protein WBX22_10520 [Silvibacterium sp.]